MTFVRVALFTFFTCNLVVYGDPSSSPTDNTCTEYVYYSENSSMAICPPTADWGGTDKGYGTMVACEPTLQSRLEESYANHLFEHCHSWCIYDFMDRGESAYVWRSAEQENGDCWHEVTQWLCYNDANIPVKETMANKSLSTCPRTSEPTPAPTPVPTTAAPTFSPSWAPTNTPSTMPTTDPTNRPTNNPTNLPTDSPTTSPTDVPTENPSNYPTDFPSTHPSFYPTSSPTYSPTEAPTFQPTPLPTLRPSSFPTEDPTISPSQSPTIMPTNQPTSKPTSLSPTLSPTTLYSHYVICTVTHRVHSETLDYLHYLAEAIGEVLGLREPENEVIILQTRLPQSSTDFQIMLEHPDTAAAVVLWLQTTQFTQDVTEEFNIASGFTLETISVDLVSGPHCYMCAAASDNTPIIIIAAAAGGVAALLCYFIFRRFKKQAKRRYIQKQVTQMFSEAPGTYRWENDLPAITPPSEKEIEHLFEEDYMDMDCQIEGFTTIGSGEEHGRGVTEGGTRTFREGDNKLRVLQLDQLIRQTPNGDSSVSESESDSSNESPDEQYSLSPSQKKSPREFMNFMHIPVDEIIERVKVSPGLIDKPRRSAERNGKW